MIAPPRLGLAALGIAALSAVPSSAPLVGTRAPAQAGVTQGASIAAIESEELGRLKAQLEAERRAWVEREAELVRKYEARIAALQRELAQRMGERVEREEEWLRYTRAFGAIAPVGAKPPAFAAPGAPEAEAQAVAPSSIGDAPSAPRSIGDAPSAPDGANAADSAAPREAAAPATDAPSRDVEIARALRSLFVAEEVRGLDLLEAGSLADGWTGPVVLRVLDDRGRPLGSIAAERLRLEASRAAQTVTLVLEKGHESRLGERFAFGGSDETKRIVLPDVDPRPWIEALPELFGDDAVRPAIDDGRWDLVGLRSALNDLLRLDASSGFYRVRTLGGVQGGVLRDVQIEHLDPDGRLERRLFADRLQILAQDRGVMLLLESGAQVRGDRKTPFLDGRYRIFLPRADVAQWTAARLPGLSPASAAPDAPPERPPAER